jgi:hypothetical protein
MSELKFEDYNETPGDQNVQKQDEMFPDSKNAVEKITEEAIKEEAQFTTDPVCPYCGYEDDCWWEGLDEMDRRRWEGQGAKDDGEEWEITCPECDNEYICKIHIVSKFMTRKSENFQEDNEQRDEIKEEIYVDLYVDLDSGTRTGSGTIDDPYGDLNYACMELLGKRVGGKGYRLNLKRTGPESDLCFGRYFIPSKGDEEGFQVTDAAFTLDGGQGLLG